MSKIKSKDRKFGIVYSVLSVWWTLVFMIGFLQAYFMSQKGFFIILILITPFVSWFVLRKLYKQIIKRKAWARILVYVVVLIHFIPLILQFAGFRSPGVDSVISGVIGLGIIWSLEN